MAGDWSREEVEATVADYFAMLEAEIRGESYSKTGHRRALRALLSGRSDGAIERKHGNISAVLREAGHPWIDGYKPYGNYQQLLADVVLERLESDGNLVSLVREEVESPAAVPSVLELSALWEPAPEAAGADRTSEVTPGPYGRVVRRGIDFLAIEARNRSLGAAGEALVMQFEADRLHRAGARRLADRVEHVSSTKGDGLGYDIHSYEADGRDRLIEVKTTRFGKRTPFYVSRNEVACSASRPAEYHLYRLFKFRDAPRLFALNGRLDQTCRLDAHQFVAHVA